MVDIIATIAEPEEITVTLEGNNITKFTELIDTPSTYSGQTGKVPTVNVGETALEFTSPGAIWGGITGTLSNQTDLQTALDLKTEEIDFTTHTGDTTIHFTQGSISIPASQISDFDTEVSNNSSVIANTAKVTNAIHTGDVTGSTALTITADAVDDTHINWGIGANQVNTADIPELTNLFYTEARVSANTDVATNTTKISYTDATDVGLNTIHRGTTTGNPHSVNKTDVGLSNVPNVDTTNAANISSGTLSSSVLPPVALTTVQVAISEVAMLALTTEEGDVVVRSDENKSYMRNSGITGTIADFTELQTPTDSVLSVNSQTGTVVLNQDNIANGSTYVQTTNDYTTTEKNKLSGVELLADVTDATNVTAAGALMDSEVDVDIKTLTLPANTTISTYGATVVDDLDATTARGTLDVDQAGTDNSTNVTLAGTPDYITISGQVITRNNVDLVNDVTGNLPIGNLNSGTGASSSSFWRGDGQWATPAGSGNVSTSGTPVVSDYAKFVNGTDIEGRSYTEVKSDLGLDNVTNVATDDTAYNSTSWDTNVDAATKNAIRDKFVTNDAIIALNTSKVTNATHTGDVTGSTALTISNDAVDIAMLSATGTPSASTFLRGDNTWSAPAGSGTVTSVAAGNGLDFITITGSGSVTMGTPGTTTAISTNAVTTTSHTHQLDESGISITASQVSDFDTEVSNNSSVTSNTAKVTNVTTNLSEGTSTATTVDVNSSDGTNATLVSASTLRAGLMTKAKFDEVVANSAKVTNATHTGEVTGSTALVIADNIIDEANLKLDEAPTNDYVLTADSTKSGGMKWSPSTNGGTSAPFEQSFTATSSQTNFTLTNEPVGAWVWINGASQDASTWSISGNDIVLSTPATLNDAVEIYYFTNISVSTKFLGTFTAGESLVNGDLTYLKSDGKYWKADADVVATSKGRLAIAQETIAADATGSFLTKGEQITTGLTIADELFISTTAGTWTNVAPAASNNTVRIIGYSLSTTVLYFDPDKSYVEIA